MRAKIQAKTRISFDYYPTPAWCVHRLVEALDLPGGRWLEPAAGDGAIIKAINRKDVEWTAAELRVEARDALTQLLPPSQVLTGDFLYAGIQDALPKERFRVAITNPPYRKAEEFVQACMARADIVVCLLRLGFLASQERQGFMKAHPPDVYVLPNRPSFAHGATDNADYCWMVWPSDRRIRGHIQVLNLTSAKARY
jgi:hypothetical protein